MPTTTSGPLASQPAPPRVFSVALCDADPEFRQLLGRHLADDPRFDLSVETTTLSGLSRGLVPESTDAVLLDYMLPGVEGRDAIRLAVARMGHRPVFVYSSEIRHHVERRALAAGAAAFVPRHRDLEPFTALLHHHLCEHDPRR